MQSILLHNFKSYDHQAITNLNSRINVVLGSNGQGKSNFFKGISVLIQPSLSCLPKGIPLIVPSSTPPSMYLFHLFQRGAKVDKP